VVQGGPQGTPAGEIQTRLEIPASTLSYHLDRLESAGLLSSRREGTYQEAARTGVNASHFGIQVASSDDVVEAKLRFERAGLETFTEEDAACCYAVQDKVWVEDPDGNLWEVFVVKGDAEVMIGSERQGTESSCCPPSCCAP
jgi:DNA-binding transcriptional ArsR family regulator